MYYFGSAFSIFTSFHIGGDFLTIKIIHETIEIKVYLSSLHEKLKFTIIATELIRFLNCY
jgi:hypothetical protein